MSMIFVTHDLSVAAEIADTIAVMYAGRIVESGPVARVLNSCRTAGIGVRRGKAALSSGCEAHPAISLQPEAIGAVMEVTKWLKPSISGHDLVTARVCRRQRE